MMTLEQWIAGALLAAGMLALLTDLLRRRRRRALLRLAAAEASAGRATQAARDLKAQLDAMARDIDEKMAGRINELRELLDDVEARAVELRALALPPDPPDHDPNYAPQVLLGEESQRPASRLSGREVHDLADEGLDAAEIAHRLDRPIGEVQLILNLQRRTSAGS